MINQGQPREFLVYQCRTYVKHVGASYNKKSFRETEQHLDVGFSV